MYFHDVWDKRKDNCMTWIDLLQLFICCHKVIHIQKGYISYSFLQCGFSSWNLPHLQLNDHHCSGGSHFASDFLWVGHPLFENYLTLWSLPKWNRNTRKVQILALATNPCHWMNHAHTHIYIIYVYVYAYMFVYLHTYIIYI